MSRNRLILPLALACLLIGSASAGSEPPRDYDADEEESSSLWERVLDPAARDQATRIERVRTLITKRDAKALADAEQLLTEAIAANPDQPAGYFWLGRIHSIRAYRDASREHRSEETAHGWAECARNMRKAYELAPSWMPAGEDATAVDLELALCSARSGDYEVAENHLKRILSRGDTGRLKVHFHLGEVYMALGRLVDAIDSFEQALKLSAPYDAELNFALAVAYDRDEQSSRSREHLRVALTREPHFNSLWAHGKVYVPAADEHYYLGLAYLTRGEHPWALYHLRRYVESATHGAWKKRGELHLASALEWEPGSDLEVKGTATVDRDRAAQVVARADDKLQACVAKTPNLLFEVRATRYVATSSAEVEARVRRGGVRPGVKVVLHRNFGHKPEQVAAARDCIKRASAALKLPNPSGTAGTWATVEFMVIARQPAR